MWEKTDEPLFLEEEREKELERLYSQDESEKLDIMNRAKKQGEEAGEEEVEAVSKQTTETLMAGEKIIEALILAEADIELSKKYAAAKQTMDPTAAQRLAPPARNAIFSAFNDISAFAYVLKVIQKLPRAALEDALLVLPFTQVTMLLIHIDHWAKKASPFPTACPETEPMTRCGEHILIGPNELLIFHNRARCTGLGHISSVPNTIFCNSNSRISNHGKRKPQAHYRLNQAQHDTNPEETD